jgi:DnaD/phage-associated family protein
MAVPWFRFYTEVLNDPKIIRLSDKEFRAWVLMLCIAAENDGAIDFNDLPIRLRMPRVKAGQLFDALVANGLISQDDGEYARPHNWNVRQYKSDVSTTRVKRFRERHETVSETPPEADTETEAEQKQTRDRAEAESAQPQPPVIRLFERCFGRLLSPMEIEQIHALQEEHPYDRIEYGIREAAELNKRSVRYVQRVCEGQANGDTNGANRRFQATGADTGGVANGVSNLDRLRAAVAARERGG